MNVSCQARNYEDFKYVRNSALDKQKVTLILVITRSQVVCNVHVRLWPTHSLYLLYLSMQVGILHCHRCTSASINTVPFCSCCYCIQVDFEYGQRGRRGSSVFGTLRQVERQFCSRNSIRTESTESPLPLNYIIHERRLEDDTRLRRRTEIKYRNKVISLCCLYTSSSSTSSTLMQLVSCVRFWFTCANPIDLYGEIKTATNKQDEPL